MKLVDYILDKVFISLALKFKKNIVQNIGTGKESKKVLLYFKSDPFFSKRLRNKYVHTNNEEIVSMVKILNEFGYLVDVVDRDSSWEEILKLKDINYDLLISNCAGNSAKHHIEMSNQLSFKKRVVFAAGPEPIESNKLVAAQYKRFEDRNNLEFAPQRMVKGANFEDRFQNIDSIFYIGNEFGKSTYSKYDIPSHRIYPSTSFKINDNVDLSSKDPKHFVYFGGNGAICKGLDLVLETFDGLTDLKLDICAPNDDEKFWNFYKDVLKRNPNITYHGFVKIGGEKYNEITKSASYIIFPGSAEGCATSVTTCMRRGIIPVVTYQTGVDIGDFGHLIESTDVSYIEELVTSVSQTSKDELDIRIKKTIEESKKYTLVNFEKSFREALRSSNL